jgi:predicted protein tyrosine phosphatase
VLQRASPASARRSCQTLGHLPDMKHVLFICSQNRLRSPTAEQVFAHHPGIECTSAGTNHDADNPLSPELVEWAEIIFVMEKVHRNRLAVRFRKHLINKRVICLDIPDDYEYMDPGLVRLLKAKVSRFLPAAANEEA